MDEGHISANYIVKLNYYKIKLIIILVKLFIVSLNLIFIYEKMFTKYFNGSILLHFMNSVESHFFS